MERLNVQNSFAAFSLFFIFRRLVFWAVTFMMAVRPLPGAQALVTSGAAAIAGLIFSIHEAKRVRDMRKYPFWAR